jgi:hypothetical protein
MPSYLLQGAVMEYKLTDEGAREDIGRDRNDQ